MDGGSYEMHSENDKVPEKSAKRIVKTPAQVLALEKLYNENENPSMATKKQLADSIGLTEKQVNGWFCHRRLKDKRLMNGESHTIGRQDRSSGVIQERTSGHKQDSCGSTKLGEDKNFDTREVESGRLTQQERVYDQSSNYAGKYNNLDNASSGSSSSSSDMNGDQIDTTIPRYPIPKFSSDVKSVKARSGPSGYLKVKGVQIENSAIIAVKRQLGKHYREDGPPLGVDFDPLPPGAFEESPIHDPVDENYCTGEETSPDVPKAHFHPKFSKGYEYNFAMASHNPSMDGTGYKTTKRSEVPHNYVRQRSNEATPLAHNGTYYSQRRSSVEFPEGPMRDLHGIESRISRHHDLQLDGEKVTSERKPYNKYNYSDKNIYRGENVEKTNYYTMKGYERHDTLDKGLPRQIVKEGKAYAERRLIDDNRIRVEVPLRNDRIVAPKRMKGDLPHQQHVKRSSIVDDLPGNLQVMRKMEDKRKRIRLEKKVIEDVASNRPIENVGNKRMTMTTSTRRRLVNERQVDRMPTPRHTSVSDSDEQLESEDERQMNEILKMMRLTHASKSLVGSGSGTRRRSSLSPMLDDTDFEDDDLEESSFVNERQVDRMPTPRHTHVSDPDEQVDSEEECQMNEILKMSRMTHASKSLVGSGSGTRRRSSLSPMLNDTDFEDADLEESSLKHVTKSRISCGKGIKKSTTSWRLT